MRFAFVVGATLILATACGGTQPSGTARPTGAVPTAAPSVAAGAAVDCNGPVGLPVGILSFTFNPGSITVPVGGSVTWTNADSTPHTVTFDAGPDCGDMGTSGTVTATFGAAGSFPYHCAIHPQMKATVVVQ